MIGLLHILAFGSLIIGAYLLATRQGKKEAYFGWGLTLIIVSIIFFIFLVFR